MCLLRCLPEISELANTRHGAKSKQNCANPHALQELIGLLDEVDRPWVILGKKSFFTLEEQLESVLSPNR